jgi:hypothetical protein
VGAKVCLGRCEKAVLLTYQANLGMMWVRLEGAEIWAKVCLRKVGLIFVPALRGGNLCSDGSPRAALCFALGYFHPLPLGGGTAA